jgi:membrane protein YqaA with SNARE-associated domain
VTTATASAPLTRTVVSGHRSLPIVGLCVVGAGLSVASGAIHLHLWNEVYRHISNGHLNALFLIQAILCFVAAAAVLAMRNILAVVATAALLIGTYIGYLITRYHGWFGFDPGKGIATTDAKWSMVLEIVGTIVLLATAALMARDRRTAG